MLRRHWLTIVTCAALLVVPLLGLLLLPSVPTRADSPRLVDSAGAAELTDTVSAPATPRPPRRPSAGPSVPGGDDDDEPRPSIEVPAEALHGIVVDSDGQPVVGATVRCANGVGRTAMSDASGNVVLSDDTDGCSATAQDGVHSASPPVTVHASADNRFVMGRAGGISGVVVDEAGKPVPTYVIAIESYAPPGGDGPGPNGAPRNIQDTGGAFQWTDLPAGRYVLTASTDGRPPARSDGIQVDAGSTASNVRLVLPSGATFRGKVVDAETRKPLAGATFALDTATTSGANAIGSAESDASGAFALEGVPSRGLFSVRVSHPGYRTKILSGLDTRGAQVLTDTVQLAPSGDGGGDSELAGIGANLFPSPGGGVVVAGLVPGGPAEKGGMRRSNRVERIDGDDASVMSLAEAVQRLRGPEGSRLSVRVDRGGQKVDLQIVRAIVVR